MFNFLNRFNGCSQINWMPKKYIICSSSSVIKSLIASFDFDIFEWKVEKIDAFLRKQVQKKLNFSTSIPNFEMDFDFMIDLMMGKESLNHILFRIQKSFAYFRNIVQFFSFFKLRQRMESHFNSVPPCSNFFFNYRFKKRNYQIQLQMFLSGQPSGWEFEQGFSLGLVELFMAKNMVVVLRLLLSIIDSL